jgi:uncharacterized protein YyaL (SSP411 family)
MNRESFQDEEVAKVLNEYFVPIKVDREERPDIDKVYMTFAEAMTGSGGWPLNVLITDEGNPFFIGTYFPKKSRDRLTGLIDLLEKTHKLWNKDKEKIIEESNYIVEEVKDRYMDYAEGHVEEDIYAKTKEGLKRIFDRRNGGFGRYPKFPMPQYVWFLLEHGDRKDDKESIEIATITLDKMYKGGIFDHVGYGFCRYSVDEKWLVPHFEKMLYDNALLSIIYAKAYKITRKSLYKEIGEKIFEFVLRDMTSEEGGFYSALDADSEGQEGKFYVFDYKEVIDLLGEELGDLYCKYYDITKEGNFEGKNIPNLIDQDLEKMSSLDKSKLDSINQMIFNYREKRVKPHRDEKILTSWNGLMIGALAYGGITFDNEIYINRAKKAADFIIANCIDKEGHLLSTYIDGKSYNVGFLEDYVFFIYGLLQLFESTKEEVYLNIGIRLTEDMLNLFWDEKEGGLYFYSNISEQLILKTKDFYDGAIPSGNSFALISLLKLYIITKEEKYSEKVRQILYAAGEDINNNPLSHIYSIIALGNLY